MYQRLVEYYTILLRCVIFLVANIALSPTVQAQPVENCHLAHSQKEVDWELPLNSPTVKNKKTIAFIASDMRNGGVESVAIGVAEAMSLLGWHLVIFDGKGTGLGQSTALLKAELIDVDGFILGGIDEKQQYEYIERLSQQKKPIIGWHSSESIELSDESFLFANITTNAAIVGRKAACYAIANAKKPIKAVIFTDNDFAIARIKTQAMIDVFENCVDCEILAIENISLSRDRTSLSKKIYGIMESYKNDITHFMSINDIYFDYLQAILEGTNVENSKNFQAISAGDGSQEAYQRIKQNSFQKATVPEPLSLQGWQIVDELNRSFNGLEASGYSAPLVVVDKENIALYIDMNYIFEPRIDYRSHFKRFWFR